MERLHALILGLVQDITEFLPNSSSAHLILFPAFVGWVDQGAAFDLAVHVGTLLAVVFYFRRDVTELTRDGLIRLSEPILPRRQDVHAVAQCRRTGHLEGAPRPHARGGARRRQ